MDQVPKEGERIQRARRPLAKIVKELPLDWLLERNRLPGMILSVALPLSALAGAVLGASLGNVLFYNWAVSLAPSIALTARLVFRRVIDGYWTPSLWTRPQAHQKKDIAPGPEEPVELSVDTTGMTRPARKLMEFEAWLINTAETDPPSWKTRACGFVDDWLNERARTPGFLVSITLIAVGLKIALPFTVLFPVNLLVSGIPTLIAAYLFKRTGDAYRFTRPGLHQRPKRVSLVRKQRGLDDFAIAGRAVAAEPQPEVALAGLPQPVIHSPEPNMSIPLRQNRGAGGPTLDL